MFKLTDYQELLDSTNKKIAAAEKYLWENRVKISLEKERDWEKALDIHKHSKKYYERKISELSNSAGY